MSVSNLCTCDNRVLAGFLHRWLILRFQGHHSRTVEDMFFFSPVDNGCSFLFSRFLVQWGVTLVRRTRMGSLAGAHTYACWVAATSPGPAAVVQGLVWGVMDSRAKVSIHLSSQCHLLSCSATPAHANSLLSCPFLGECHDANHHASWIYCSFIVRAQLKRLEVNEICASKRRTLVFLVIW